MILVLIMAVCLSSCKNEKNKIVAEFGDQKLTMGEFRIAYLDVIKKPDMFDSKETREKFLDELIASRILAMQAEKEGYYTEEMQYRTQAYQNKALREAHFDSVIRPLFTVSEEDIQEAYRYMQEQRRLSHLFAETRSGIDSIYALLQKGISFEQISAEIFTDTVLAANGGDLGWVYWDELEYDMAMMAFRLSTGKHSEPVRSQFGYHIIKVTDYKKNPLITRTQYEARKQKAKAKLEYMLGDKYAFSYLNDLMRKAEFSISPDVATSVRSKLKHIFTRKPDQLNPSGELQLNDTEVKKIELNLWDMRNDILATINGKAYTVGQFIGALNFVPYQITYHNFKNAMYYAFRDYLIEQEAIMFGLDKSETVQEKYNLFREYLLQLEFRRDLVRNTRVTDEEKTKFFLANKEKFADAEFSQVEKIITDILERQKRAGAVPAYLASLTQDMEIKKYPEIIHAYYDPLLQKN